MRRTGSVIAVSIAFGAVAVPAPAGAAVLDTYQELAAGRMSPAPLVPTSVPRSLAPIDRTIAFGSTQGGRGYALRMSNTGPEAVLLVTGGEFRSMRALVRDYRRGGFTRRATRIRGRRGVLLTRRLGPDSRALAWVERGVVYTVGSGTPRTVSLAALRSTARRLDRLERDWFGGSSNPDDSSEAFAVTTRRTVSADVTFEATCAPPGSPEATVVRVGEASVTLMRRNGNTFAFDIAEHNRDGEPWTGTVTGTISPSAITLEVRATGTIQGDVCDTGPLTLTLDHRAS